MGEAVFIRVWMTISDDPICISDMNRYKIGLKYKISTEKQLFISIFASKNGVDRVPGVHKDPDRPHSASVDKPRNDNPRCETAHRVTNSGGARSAEAHLWGPVPRRQPHGRALLSHRARNLHAPRPQKSEMSPLGFIWRFMIYIWLFCYLKPASKADLFWLLDLI